MENSTVSGIIIFLNGERFIAEAIESVIAQTYRNWELLLVDDGSTDASTAIARTFASRYPGKIRYLEHENHQNLGMSASRNLGIRHAAGEYIAFLDADDIWLPQKLEKQAAIMQSQPEIGMVCGPTLWWYSWMDNPSSVRRDTLREVSSPYDQLFEPRALLLSLLRREARTPATCSVLLRRGELLKSGGFEETFRGMYEDQVFFSKIYLKTRVFVTGEYLDKYRQHANSCCGTALANGEFHGTNPNPAHQAYLDWLRQYLHHEQVEDSAILQALNAAHWPYRHPLLYAQFTNMRKLIKYAKKKLGACIPHVPAYTGALWKTSRSTTT